MPPKSIVIKLSSPSDDSRQNPRNADLPRTWLGYLWQNEPVLLAASAFMQLLWSSCILFGAYYIVDLMNKNLYKDQEMGLQLCLGYLGIIVTIVISYQCKELWVGRMGASIKARLSARVAEHALLRGPTSTSDKSLALVLASQDSHNICEGAKNVWQLPAAIFEGITITALVIYTAGALAGGITASLFVMGFVFLFCMSWNMNARKRDVSHIHDKQVSVFCEMLVNIRSFRYYGWDDFFLARLHAMTDSLVPAQQKLVVMKAVNSALVITFPCIPATALFIISYYQTDVSPSVQFQAVVMSLLNTFRCVSCNFMQSPCARFVTICPKRYPLWNLPSSLRAISSANNSFRRLSAFLSKKGQADTRAVAGEVGAVEIENLAVGSSGSLLKRLHVRPGSLVVLQGPAKAYKTTVLKTLAGHLPLRESETVRIGGSVSYAPQIPWMCQTTIQDNIVSCEPFDERRYNDVLRACALTQDLAAMPSGDQTPVAEKGISLSGGERQRVALARAVYRRADVYLLDNPISALDDVTQQHIWDNLFEGLLSTATVIITSSRAVRSCTSIVHLSTSGIQGDTVDISGWVTRQTPDQQLPRRYRRLTVDMRSKEQSFAAGRTGELHVNSRGLTLEDVSMVDVSADADRFEEYLAAESVRQNVTVASSETSNVSMSSSVSMAILGNANNNVSTSGNLDISMSRSGIANNMPKNFLDLREEQREANGIISPTKAIGSRRINFVGLNGAPQLDHGSNDYVSQDVAPLAVEKSALAPVLASIDRKSFLSRFMIWINFCALSKPALAAFASLYWFYPAPRLWFEQWIGFWAAKTYSADDQFNMSILGVSFLMVMLVRIALDLSAFHIGSVCERNMRKAFCSAVARAPMSFFMTENLGPLVSVFSRDMTIVGEELMQDFHSGIYYMLFSFAVSVFVCTKFPPFIAVAVVIYSLLILLQKLYSQKIVLIREEFQQAQDDVFRVLYDSLEGLEVLRSAGAEQWAIDLLAESLLNNRIAVVAVERTNVWLARRADFLAVCLCFATVMFVNYFPVPAASRGLLISGSMPILVLFNWSMKLLGNFQFLLNSVHRIQQYIDKVPSEDKSGSRPPKEFPATGELKFQNVCLRYAPSLPLALDGVSFNLAHGSKVAVVGRTGSGKSTLLVALFRLIQPCGGSMSVDGVSPTSLAVDVLRKQMAIIPQDPAMFKGTLRMNLDPYNEFSDQQVRTHLTFDV